MSNMQIDYMYAFEFITFCYFLLPHGIDCRLCFVHQCDHAAIWVPKQIHSSEGCNAISSALAMILNRLAAAPENSGCPHLIQSVQ